MSESFELERFVQAQDTGGTYRRALRDLEAGHKESHWMWFVFPQIAGLGSSPMARRYAISSLEEARAYLSHPVLGQRLKESCQTLLRHDNLSAETILGSIDAMKLRSSMTLFLRAEPEAREFSKVLENYFGGRPDVATDERLAAVDE